MASIHAWELNILGKQLPTFCPLGPVLATRDEIADPHDLNLTTTLNGEVMQSTNTNDLVFDVPALIAHYSRWYRFAPGDVVTTGSPSGVGFARDPKVFMKAGDTIEVTIGGHRHAVQPGDRGGVSDRRGCRLEHGRAPGAVLRLLNRQNDPTTR